MSIEPTGKGKKARDRLEAIGVLQQVAANKFDDIVLPKVKVD